jgi:ribosomal protein S18 acetylase RimI-like enzyme
MVRPATVEDADAIARVQVETWRAAYAHALPAETLARVDVAQRAELWRGWLGGESATFVGESDGVVRGFVGVGRSREEPGIGELYTIYVVPEAWGTGLGDALIERGERELRDRGFAEAVLSVLADNPRAERFYERHGWHRADTYRGEFLGQPVELAHHRKRL